MRPHLPRRAGALGIGFIGAGSYAATSLLPHLAADSRVHLTRVANSRGLSAKRIAGQFRFAGCATDPAAVLSDAECDAVFIASRHSLHARLVEAALEAGKLVYVEKPLCLTLEELEAIEAAWSRSAGRPTVVGFNRRFAPATSALKEFFEPVAAQPVSIHYTVHAGTLPADHWLRDPAEGGRIAGEVCHFVDWCRLMAGAPLARVFASLCGTRTDPSLHATLEFAGGGQASLVYEPSTAPGRPKERIEISRGPLSATLEDFSVASFYSAAGRKRRSFRGKGQQQMLAAVVDGFLAGRAAFPFAEALASTRATLLLLDSASSGSPSLL